VREKQRIRIRDIGLGRLLPASAGHVAFSLAAIGALAIVAVTGQVARSDLVWSKLHRLWVGMRSEIDVVSATYGLNCKEVALPAPFANTVAEGNATKFVKRVCDGQDQCRFRVDASRLGDPAGGCGKDFFIESRCTITEIKRSGFVAGEANGKDLTLSCRSHHDRPTTTHATSD